jgi:hypothetical protein
MGTVYIDKSSSMPWQPFMSDRLPWISWQQDFYKVGLSILCPTPNLEDQASVLVISGDRVTQLYPQTRMIYIGITIILRSPRGEYIDKCRYEIQEKKINSGMLCRHIPAYFEHLFLTEKINSGCEHIYRYALRSLLRVHLHVKLFAIVSGSFNKLSWSSSKLVCITRRPASV